MISWILCFLVIIFTNIAAYLTGLYFFSEDDDFIHLNIKPEELVFETDREYISFSYDTSLMYCVFHKLNDMQWGRLEEIGALLSPGYLRFGGTVSDHVIFNMKADAKNRTFYCEKNPSPKCEITDKDMRRMFFYATKINFKLLVDVSALMRSDKDWDSSNLKTMLEFAQRRYSDMHFQLGNEPNRFPKTYRREILPEQLAKDYQALKNVTISIPHYRNSKIVGPEVGGDKPPPSKPQIQFLDYMKKFLASKPPIDAVTFHHYNLNGMNASIEDFTNIESFDVFGEQIETIKTLVEEEIGKMPIWLSETSSAYGTSLTSKNISGRFVSTFMWLDKLGLAAKKGISVVVRQTLLSGSYALVDREFNPTPDYWVTAFFNNVVGTKVIEMSSNTLSRGKPYLRFYCHCLNLLSELPGTIVIYGLNLGNETEGIIMPGLTVEYPILSYIFRADSNDITSNSISLNWRTLAFNKTKFSDLGANVEKIKLPLKIPSSSIAFWVIKVTQRTICS